MQLVAEVVVHPAVAGVEDTVYPTIAEPFDAAAVQLTVTEAFPATAVTPVGASGIVDGAISAEEM